jgi:hypothetical protein
VRTEASRRKAFTFSSAATTCLLRQRSCGRKRAAEEKVKAIRKQITPFFQNQYGFYKSENNLRWLFRSLRSAFSLFGKRRNAAIVSVGKKRAVGKHGSERDPKKKFLFRISRRDGPLNKNNLKFIILIKSTQKFTY